MYSAVGIDSTGSLCLSDDILDIFEGISLARVCEGSNLGIVSGDFGRCIVDGRRKCFYSSLVYQILVCKDKIGNFAIISVSKVHPLLSVIDIVLAIGYVCYILVVVPALVRFQRKEFVGVSVNIVVILNEIVKSGLESLILDGTELVESLDGFRECVVGCLVSSEEILMLSGIRSVHICVIVVVRLVANVDYLVSDSLDFSLDFIILGLGVTLGKCNGNGCVLEGVDILLERGQSLQIILSLIREVLLRDGVVNGCPCALEVFHVSPLVGESILVFKNSISEVLGIVDNGVCPGDKRLLVCCGLDGSV